MTVRAHSARHAHGQPLRARGTRRRSLGWLWRAITAAIVFTLLLLSADEVVSLEAGAARGLEAQLALDNLTGIASGVRFLPQALTDGSSGGTAGISANVKLELKLHGEAMREATQLAQLSPLGKPILAETKRLATDSNIEIKDATGTQRNIPAAKAEDLKSGAVYNELSKSAKLAGPVLIQQTNSAQHSAVREIIATVFITGFLLILILAGFEGSRRQRMRVNAEREALRVSEERFRALVQNSSDVITVVDHKGTVLFQAPSVRTVLGYEPARLEGSNLGEIVHPSDMFRFQAMCEAGSHEGQDLRLRHASGTWLACEARGTDLREHEGVRGVVLNIRDVSERKALENELRHQAFHDSLTGLANGALFKDRIEHALVRQRRTGGPLAVLLVDLDDFKAINDSLGHDGGDRVLCQVASRLRSAVRASDTVARLGGDEFAILLEDSARGNGPARAAERALARLAPPVRVNGRSLIVSASIGAAIATKGKPGGEELLRNADVAMYAAKAQGKSRWAQFEPGMNVAVAERLELRADMVDALTAGNQMELYYQPVVDLETRKVKLVEALLRWHHPKRGLVPPMEFLPLAEECGLIVPLGRWVLRQAVTQLAAWRLACPALAGLAVSVNVSGRQLEDPGFAGEVRDALAAAGLSDPSGLILEITETTLMHEAEETITRLRELKALGTRLAIDDFGTGYSSLGYLQHFPVDVLKIDRSFISGLAGGPRQAALAEAVVKIGASLELQTVAEGVELEEQVGQLRALACGYGQGYLFAEPLPALAFEALFASPPAPALPMEALPLG